MTGNEIRQLYLDYFQKHGHRVVRSSSLIPQDDPTLLFTNAGMVQFKRTFLGEEKRDYVRATTSQKCVRAGGKHNDLENVGYTARHHTFFEMLGNFSFGDYFKEKAVDFAWDLLTNGYGLPAEKLWASVYLDDDEAYDLWHRRIGIPESRMIRLGEEENFWAMGDTGPCGPCSEIHLDRGAEYGCGRPDCDVACDCDRFLEIWNLVFMQFNRDASGTMTPLPKPSIDTGLGLERMASVVQKVNTNYDTDLIYPIIQRTASLAEKPYGRAESDDVAMKVIADHSRAAAFLIGDGVLPSNEGRGYVLRRIMRRAIRYGRNIGLVKPFLHETAQVVFDIMVPAYPELKTASAFITNVIENEELRFSETLDNGLRVLNETLSEVRAKGATQVPGDLIFKLYDTFGFPVDIVRDVVRDEGMTLDIDRFDQCMEEQRKQSRSKIAFTGVSDAYRQLSATGEKPEFVGYGTLACEARVVLVVRDNQGVDAADAGTPVEVVTTATPFYGEAGGQVGDHGTITAPGMEMIVSDTVKDPTGIIIHKGEVKAGRLENGQTVMLTVDGDRRAAVAANHTATHILHAALRHELGDHVKQAGSMVAADRLRFDFTHFSQIDSDALERIESFVNHRIRQNVPVAVEEMDMDRAMKSGATALFEEKYGDRVRVVALDTFSRELCGGTHTGRTGNIGLFKIISESSVASGIRRIEALTGSAALTHAQKTSQILQQLSHLVKEKPDALVKRVESVMTSLKSLEKETERLKTQIAEMQADGSGEQAIEINGVTTIVQQVTVDKPSALRELADRFKDRIQSGVVVLGCESDGKALLIVVVTKDLKGRFHAGKMIKEVASVVGGNGGGRPDMAQAGGTQPQHLALALEKARELIQQG
ncbi:alanine--tRNA ligase [uncultured Desulfosarcina sp.]|uniref:alanine--tRNA ligase n=1 Tax=uncultured Desulfosarcina sp. TaxID=218289 RepID=UPI0029C9A457|nr:alanine--tRNA ligase [uncultured Desulfosarcina sp.]